MRFFIVYRNYRKKKKNRCQEDRRENNNISIPICYVFEKAFNFTLPPFDGQIKFAPSSPSYFYFVSLYKSVWQKYLPS